MQKIQTTKHATGHLLACLTVLIWGTTFISTKTLLLSFSPIELLFFRFLIGFAALWLIHPHPLSGTTIQQELLYAGAGLCGITLYFLLENIALTYSTASNIGVIVSLTPFFTALLASWLLKAESLNASFFIGFSLAMCGIVLISFADSSQLHLNVIGDLLGIFAAIAWAFYSILTRKIALYQKNTIQTTRRTFFYGLLFMLPVLFFFDIEWRFDQLILPVNLFNILFLGLGASALCFVTWNVAVKILGVVKTSVYIYLVPVITIITAVILLDEELNWMIICGTALTLLGLFVSERLVFKKSDVKKNSTQL